MVPVCRSISMPTVEFIDAALAIIGVRSPLAARIQRIRNTLCLEEVEVSEPCLAERNDAACYETTSAAHALTLDAEGNLPPF